MIGMVGLANRPGGYDDETVRYLQPLLGTCSQLISADRSERTRKKADEEFKRREAELQRAQRLESLGLLAGGVAHDFNNMLTPVLGYAGLLLQDTPADDFRREYLEAIERAAEQARALTHQLLAFSREQVLELGTVDLGDVVVEYEKTLRRLVREDIDMEVHIECEEAWIEADPSRLGQVLLNLAVNAQDAMPKGGRLSMEVSDVVLDGSRSGGGAEAKTGSYIVLSVTDTGHGMDEEMMSVVFDPFYSTKDRGKGTGLGLATVHGIVRQHNGWIDTRSAPNEGTTFSLYFPRADKSGKRSAVPVEGESISGGSETVLVVEDEELVRTLVCALLTEKGYSVIEAEDGEDAVLRMERHEDPVDLLLTDVVMPKMGGRELYRRLRETRPALRVLLMSGYTDGLMDRDDVSEPGVSFLAKPFSATSLPRKVRGVLDGGSTTTGS